MVEVLRETIDDSNKDYVEISLNNIDEKLTSLRSRHTKLRNQYKDLANSGASDQEYTRLLPKLSQLMDQLEKYTPEE